MSRLVLVSNRVASPRGGQGAGGLVVALAEAVRDRHGLWFGWSGRVGAQVEHRETWRKFELVRVDLSTEEYESFYLGFSNRCLWPLLHFRADLMEYETRLHEGYRRVNRRFAEILLPQLRDDDLIWVHDFHLLPLAEELRAAGARQRMGFFLHTSFPPREILAALPGHGQLARALFAYDLAGFQTQEDVARFEAYALAECGARAGAGGSLSAFQRFLRTGTFPIGIDVQQMQSFAAGAVATRECARMREALRGRQQIIGVDRLDYSKGLRRRMQSFEIMLARHSGLHGQVEFLQIAPISRSEVKAYRDFRRELELAALAINTRFAQLDWTPVRCLNRTLKRQQLAGIFRASRVGLVTPVRDGMNLVAKEYVAAQDSADPGVLLLSCFAGASERMNAALVVNPYDAEAVAEAIHRALTMGLPERRERQEALLKELLDHGARDWATSFIKALQQTSGAGMAKAA